MVIINRSNSTKYSVLSDRDILPGTKSADTDVAGLASALKSIVDGCGNIFCLILNDNERKLVDKLLNLDEIGRATKIVLRPKLPNPLEALMKREAEETARKVASIKAERAKEEAINNETTYTSKQDVDAAKKKASAARGDIAAKKINSIDENTSLADLMGNNKFIEESMKHSHIATAVASEEGWDMDKMNAPKVDAVKADPPASTTEQPTKSSKKNSRRKKDNA